MNIKNVTTFVKNNKVAVAKKALIVGGSTLALVLAAGFINELISGNGDLELTEDLALDPITPED